MNTSVLFDIFSNFSKNLFYFIILFISLNIESSLRFLTFFEEASPSILSIMMYIFLRKLSINLSNLMLFTLGILYDVLFAENIGTSSLFFLVIKYITQHINYKYINDNNEDWIYFTIIFISSFFIKFIFNIFLNMKIPDFNPILFHIGITLIIFPFIVVGIKFIYFVTKLIKN
jgi:rod shape-determining protein MreD|tara:strand:- start:147 stop:665 length:519 start_codon:yes stop_codon:yes gene_type:complete